MLIGMIPRSTGRAKPACGRAGRQAHVSGGYLGTRIAQRRHKDGRAPAKVARCFSLSPPPLPPPKSWPGTEHACGGRTQGRWRFSFLALMHASWWWRRVATAAAVPRRTPKASELSRAAEMSAEIGHEMSEPVDPTLRYAFLRHTEAEASATQQRLSPAARLGSGKVDGNAIFSMPERLHARLSTMIRASHKAQLRRDAEHVAQLERRASHDDRTGLALRASQYFVQHLPRQRAVPLFLATQFPARYAVLVRVLDEVRRRLAAPPGASAWHPTHVVDFCAHTSEALWAYDHVFGAQHLREFVAEARFSTLLKALVELQDDEAWSHIRTVFRVRGDKPHVHRPVPLDDTTPLRLGIHAYGLSAAASDVAREREVLRMWKSEADVLVLVEEATPRGFACVSAARSQLLSMGRASTTPCHVVAPCPHDQACPLLADTPRSRKAPAICSYTQLFHMPPFMRATTQQHRGDAATSYCYLIVQRGHRPSVDASTAAWTPSVPVDLQPHVPRSVQRLAASARTGVLDHLRSGRVLDADETTDATNACTSALQEAGVDEHRVMQTEAYAWPRLIRPPLKKGGHVTMDACCASGDLRRFTLPRSAGRQAYQDARKALHGDMYAHMHAGSRTSTSVPAAASSTDEYLLLGPDAQWEAQTHGRVSKRVSSRAPKHRLADLDHTTRSTRQPSRADLDALLALEP